MASTIKVDQIQLSDGSTPTAADLGLDVAGSVVQVVSQNSDTLYTTTSTAWQNTDIAVTITPKYANSMMIVCIQSVVGAGGAISTGQAVYRDSTKILMGQAVSGVTQSSGPSAYGGSSDSNNNETVAIQGADFPNTTSPITYMFKFRSPQSGTVRLNDLGSGSRNASYSQTSMSNITVYEIAQ